jgi:hypothetical protein
MANKIGDNMKEQIDKIMVIAGTVIIALAVIYYLPSQEVTGVVQSILTGLFGIATGMAIGKEPRV